MQDDPNDGSPLRSHEADAMDRWLDAGLGEALGGERAPDVTAQVLARAAAGERPELRGDDEDRIGAGRWRQVWLAALLLLGIGVVGGVAWLQRAGSGGGAGDDVVDPPAHDVAALSRQAPGQEGEVFVRSRREIATLPTDLRAAIVQLGKIGMEEFAARCPKLEVLHVYGDLANEKPRRHEDDTEANAEELLSSIARLSELRELRLVFVRDFESKLGQLRGLDKLRTLFLQGVRSIGADGVAEIASLDGLTALSIECPDGPLTNALLEAIGGLTRLEQLDLRGEQSLLSMDLEPLAELKQLRDFEAHLWMRLGNSYTSCVGDDVVQAWPNLRRLAIPDAAVTARVGARIRANTPQLVELDLGSASNVDTSTVRDLVHLPQLRKLRIAGHRSVNSLSPQRGPEVVPLLAAAPSLQDVDLGFASWFTLEHAATLLAAGKRVRIERDDAAFQLQLADLHRQHTYRQIHSVTDVKALTPMVRHVQVRNLGDRAAVALGACPWLEVVEFVRDDEDPLTATGLDAVLSLPALRRLDIVGIDDLPADALRSLAKAKALQTLSLTGCAVGDDVLGALPSLPKLRELHLLAVRGFGDVGMRGIVGCRLLSSLTLSSCKHLTTEQLALVGELRALTRLALADLPNLRDRAVMPLQHLLGLGDLDLTRGPFTSKAMQALDGLPMLRRLVLAECSGLVTSALLHVPTSVQDLDLTGCRLDATAPALLRDRFPKLRMLRLWNADWLDDDGFRALLAAPSLRQLIAGDCTKMTPVHADAIRAAKRLISLDVTRSTCLRDEDLPGLAADRPDLKVVRKVW